VIAMPARLCLDTLFLDMLAKKRQDQVEVVKRAIKGQYFLVLPVICLSEFAKKSEAMRGKRDTVRVIDSFVSKLNSISTAIIRGIDVRVAKESGHLQHRYSLSLGDSLVAATGICNQCKYIVSNDHHFDRIRHLIKRRWAFSK